MLEGVFRDVCIGGEALALLAEVLFELGEEFFCFFDFFFGIGAASFDAVWFSMMVLYAVMSAVSR
jgi:hypothetical protein